MQICVNTVAHDLSCLVLLRACVTVFNRHCFLLLPLFFLDPSQYGNLSQSSLAI